MNTTHTKRLISLLLTLLLMSLISATSGASATPIQDAPHQQHKPLEIPSETPSLQETINQASPGATIELAAGTYTDILTISTPLHLKGAGPTQTLLQPTSQANGYAIHIKAPYVKISNLSITNQGKGLYTTAIKITAPHTTIQDCTIHDTPVGIALWSSHNTITRCSFIGCDDEGIVLLGTETNPCTNNTITSCLFQHNCDGIELQHAQENLITNCMFIKNTHAGIDAIQAKNNHNTISHCTFIDNAAFGLYLSHSTDNLITDCVFTEDSITLVQSTDNTLQNSQVTRIHLMKHSSLHIQDCRGLSESAIITQQSSYEIHTEPPHHLTKEKTTYQLFYHRLLSILVSRLSRIKNLKSLYEELTQIRM